MIEKLQKLIDNSKNIVLFSGAGISTGSGIKDFRGKNGIYKSKLNVPVEYLLSKNCFYNNIYLFYDFYKKNMNSLNAKPNIVHNYFKKLEDTGKLKAIITQNIDGLHTKAGCKNVLEIHGSIYRNYCLKCGKYYDANYIFTNNDIPICSCGGIIKPDVVLYGECLPTVFDDAIDYIKKSDLLIVVGTSLTVEPACSLVNYSSCNLVIINESKTQFDDRATLVINDDLQHVFKKLR